MDKSTWRLPWAEALHSQEEAFFRGVGGSETTCIFESIYDEMVGVPELVKSLCSSEASAMGIA